jgi:polyferredoxin
MARKQASPGGFIAAYSRSQRWWVVLGGLLVVALVVVGLLSSDAAPEPTAGDLTTEQSLREIAPALGVTGKALARELDLPLDAPKAKPLSSLGVSGEALAETVHHLQGHRDAGVKYWLFAALVVWGWIWLVRTGRPDGIGAKRHRAWYPRLVYTVALVISAVAAGFLLGKSPNPMEGAVKLFKTMVGLYPDAMAKVLALAFFLGLAVVGNKLICGWGCPFGALQELVHSLPFLKKLKSRWKPPFWLMNGIRVALFAVVLLLLFGVVGGRRGYVLYHILNPFNLFNLEIESLGVLITIAASLLLGLVIYRPFCHVICPFGLLSWVVERASIFRIRIDADKCTDCGACAKACPSTAAQGILDGSAGRADCFSCARCLPVCPTDAIRYESVFRRRSG